MKYYRILISSIILTMSFVLVGHNEVSFVDFQSKYSFTDIIPEESPASKPINRMASFPQKSHTFIEYLTTHFEYPEIAKKYGFEGTVIVRFKVGEDGKITSPKIIQSVHHIIDVEIINIIKNMPDWSPQILNGQIISSTVEVPFELGLR